MNPQVIKNRIGKALAYTLTAILFLGISAFLVLQMPPVQKYLITRFLGNFTQVTGFRTTVEGFRMLWFDRLELSHVSVYDTENNQMIRAREILINFKLTELLTNSNVNIDGIYLDSAHVFLTKVNESDTARDLNINVFIANINNGYGGSGGGGRSPRINIGEAFVNESQFTYVDQDLDSIKEGFDYRHFSLAVDEGQLNSFVILGDTTEFNVKTLIAQDLATSFTVHQISTFFRLCQTSMEFSGLDLLAGKTTVSDTVILSYKKLVDLNDFINKVTLHANLTNSVIDPNDLEYFIPGADRVDQPFMLNGKFNGRINKFRFTGMRVDIGNSHVNGSLEMDGLPNINETFMVVNLRKSVVDPRDLSFLFNQNTMRRIRPLGQLSMDGQFLGYPTDFVANGNFMSALGGIRSDINFKVNENDIDRSVYSGNLSLDAFDVGTYLEDSTFQRVTMKGRVRGKGITARTADFRLDGQVHEIGINGYNYRNILTNARVAAERFDGFVQIDDPNLQMTASGSIDLSGDHNIVKVEASLDTAYFHALNLTKDSIFLHADFSADISGLSLDSLEGKANFHNFQIDYNGETLELDSIILDARRTPSQRGFSLKTSLADAEVTGNYKLSDLFENFQTLSHEFRLNIENNALATANYYRQKKAHPKSYQADFTLNLKNIAPLTRLLSYDLAVSENTILKGTFTGGYTSSLRAYGAIDSLWFNGSLFTRNEFDLSASKISDSTNVLGVISLSSEAQTYTPAFRSKDLLLEGIWNKNHIDFSLDADQDGQPNYMRLKGGVDFMRDSTVVIMETSELKMLGREWHFRDDNRTVIRGSEVHFRDVTLANGEQSIGLDGLLSEDPRKILSMNADDVDLSLLNVLTKQKFQGVADARVDISSFYGRRSIQNEVNIRGLTIDNFLVGDVTGKNEWDTTRRTFVINLAIDQQDTRILNLLGEYDRRNKESPLNLLARLERANINLLEPFLGDLFSRMGGTVSGDFRITGPLYAPIVSGEGDIADGQLMINYLKTLYAFTGKVGLTENSIYFKDIELTDTYRSRGQLNGTISHVNFNSMSIVLDASFNNLQVLNTSLKDNSLFFGQGYATGKLEMRGPLSNLRIYAQASTRPKTKIYIPVSGASSTDQKDFIRFDNFTDTSRTKKVVANVIQRVSLTGITFDLDLDVTPDAYCEIIFDIKAGDIIRGRGNGDLKIQVDSKGEFNMFGPFVFTEGRYNFTLYDIINKEFEIKAGSRINWLGDPYQGIMDIDASYNQLASLYTLIPQQGSDDQQLRRKYPIQVLLMIDGPMLTPAINFDIVARDLPQGTTTNGVNLDLVFTAFKARLDEQELKRQVFSLIVLRRFSPPESFNTSGSVASSLSELLSNQLSYWMSQVDENLELDVDVASMDQESFNTFQLRFSYTFLNGRLRVTGDGTYFNQSQVDPTQATPSNIAGDWTVDYKLTADGKLRVKMYSRTNINPIPAAVQQTYLTTGASIVHTQSFDELRDMFASSRRQRRREAERVKANAEATKEEDGSD